MSKIMIIGDIHGRVKNPISRTDDISDVLCDKFRQLKAIAVKEGVTAVISTGDLLDKARVTNEALLLMSSLISAMAVPFHVIVGNHDMIGNTMEGYELSSLNLLARITENLLVLDRPTLVGSAMLHPRHYGDNDYMLDMPKDANCNSNIIICHAMISNSATMFDTILAADIETNADMVICGHNHNKVYYAHDKKIVYNPGALLRLTAATEDRQRQVEIGILNTAKELVLKRIELKISDTFVRTEESATAVKLSDDIVAALNATFEHIKSTSEIMADVLSQSNYSDDVVEKLKEYISA